MRSIFVSIATVLFLVTVKAPLAQDISESKARCLISAIENADLSQKKAVFPSLLTDGAHKDRIMQVHPGRFATARLYQNSRHGLGIYDGRVYYSLADTFSTNDGWIPSITFTEADRIFTNGRCSLGLRAPEPTIKLQANFLTETRWPSTIINGESVTNINVCWENPDNDNEYYRNLVQKAVEDTWDKVSGVNFTGWAACSNRSRGIRVVFKDEPGDNWPHTKGLGSQLDGRYEGMLLNYRFLNWGRGRCLRSRDYCVRVIAVHEFGHALGFAHEQARSDTPSSLCTSRQRGGEIDGDMYIGEWDLSSIMNYCNPKYNNDGKLSDTDVLAVQKIYGPPESANSCSYDISSDSVSVSSIGGSGTINISASSSSCSWSSRIILGGSWISMTPSAGRGSTTITYTVAENTSSDPRRAVLSIAEKMFSVSQSGRPAPVLPDKPARLSATATSPSSVRLTWQYNSSDESGFYIFRWLGTVWGRIGEVTSNARTFTDTSLNADTSYSYYVAAYNIIGIGENSEVVQVRTPRETHQPSKILSLRITGQFNEVTIGSSLFSSGGTHTISGMNQRKSFFESSRTKIHVHISGQFNKIYVPANYDLTYTSSGQFNEVIRTR